MFPILNVDIQEMMLGPASFVCLDVAWKDIALILADVSKELLLWDGI